MKTLRTLLREGILTLTPNELTKKKPEIEKATEKGDAINVRDEDDIADDVLGLEEGDGATDEDLYYENVGICPECGQENAPLGKLGNLLHYRCRNCGMMFNKKITEAFKSKAQQKACYAKKNRGEAGTWDCDEWSDKTNFKKLPNKIEELALQKRSWRDKYWRQKLQKVYSDFEEFKQWDNIYSLAKRLGFRNAAEAWKTNPLIQGSTNPKDYRVIGKTNKMEVYRLSKNQIIKEIIKAQYPPIITKNELIALLAVQ